MAASAAERGYGGTLVKTGFTAFLEITDIGDFGVSRADIEITSHDSDNSANEFIPALLEAGEITITGNYISADPSGQVWAIETDFAKGNIDGYTLTLPNSAASTFVFEAYIKNYKVKPDLKGQIKYTIVLKITGAPTFTV